MPNPFVEQIDLGGTTYDIHSMGGSGVPSMTQAEFVTAYNNGEFEDGQLVNIEDANTIDLTAEQIEYSTGVSVADKIAPLDKKVLTNLNDYTGLDVPKETSTSGKLTRFAIEDGNYHPFIQQFDSQGAYIDGHIIALQSDFSRKTVPANGFLDMLNTFRQEISTKPFGFQFYTHWGADNSHFPNTDNYGMGVMICGLDNSYVSVIYIGALTGRLYTGMYNYNSGSPVLTWNEK